MSAAILAALLALFPSMNYAPCVRANAPRIAAEAARAERELGVPPEVLLVVGLLESHWGCNPASGGCWGAPIDFRHRGTAGTPLHAARVLANGYRACGDWTRAVAWFRSGDCRPRAPGLRGYVRRATALMARVAPARGGGPR